MMFLQKGTLRWGSVFLVPKKDPDLELPWRSYTMEKPCMKHFSLKSGPEAGGTIKGVYNQKQIQYKKGLFPDISSR